MYFWRGIWDTFLQALLPARIAVPRDLLQNYNYDKRDMSFFLQFHK
jgi:hypothetical protein